MLFEDQYIKYTKEQAIRILNSCKKRISLNIGTQKKEFTIHYPAGDMKYESIWIRDVAMMATSGLIGIEELKGYLEIIAYFGQNNHEKVFLKNGLTIPSWCIADHINFDGGAVYFPGTYSSGENQGNGKFGYFPPHDNQYYFIDLAYRYCFMNGDLDFFNVEIKGFSLLNRLVYAFNSYNIDSKTQLCLSHFPNFTVDWGFCDTIRKSGFLLYPSLLRYQAALCLSRIFCILKNNKKDLQYRNAAEQIKKSILTYFYDDSGWLLSSTKTCCQKDVWGTAFAIWLDLIEEPHKNKSLEVLAKAFESGVSVYNGYVRHILKGEDALYLKTAWEKSSCDYNTYQNGGYWCTPSGWYIYALFQYNKELANQMFTQLINHCMLNKNNGAPFEWIGKNNNKVDGKYFGASAALIYEMILRLDSHN